jgi:hypothetical protein
MSIEHEAGLLGRIPSTTLSDNLRSSSGTVSTSAGPLTWSFASPEVLNAQVGGQQLTITVSQVPGGASQSELVFSELGQPPYLTLQGVVDEAQRAFSMMASAGQSHLTLAVTRIDASVSAGTATVSGSWAGSPVSWTGPINLAANPFSGSMIPGWPSGAFSSELQTAAIFGGLGTAGPKPAEAAKPPSAPPGGLHVLDVGLGTIIRGLAAGGIAALAAAGTGGGSLAVWIWGLAGYDTVVVTEELTQWENELTEPIWDFISFPPAPPPAPPDLPPDPEPVDTGPVTTTSQDGSSDTDGDSTGDAGSGSGEVAGVPGHDAD